MVLGYHETQRSGEVDLLLPVRHPRRIQLLCGRLDGGFARVGDFGQETDRRKLRQMDSLDIAEQMPSGPRQFLLFHSFCQLPTNHLAADKIDESVLQAWFDGAYILELDVARA